MAPAAPPTLPRCGPAARSLALAAYRGAKRVAVAPYPVFEKHRREEAAGSRSRAAGGAAPTGLHQRTCCCDKAAHHVTVLEQLPVLVREGPYVFAQLSCRPSRGSLAPPCAGTAADTGS